MTMAEPSANEQTRPGGAHVFAQVRSLYRSHRAGTSAPASGVIAEPPLGGSLLDDCVAGDPAAWRQLHQKYFPIASAFLRRLGVHERDLEDATQDVFLRMFRYLPRFRRDSELSTWLYRLCITEARNVRRRARLRAAVSHFLSRVPEQAPCATPSLPEHVARLRIETALAALSQVERTVFVLYEMEGLRGKQIAKILACPVATVWRRLHHARQAFRRALGDDGDGTDR
jgi:RNA polymerase sigma-70 factor (ECF subfamily)